MQQMLHIIDADTLLVRAASLCQFNYDVIHRDTGEIITSVTSMKEFKDKLPPEQLEFYTFVPNVSPAVPRNGDCPTVIGKFALRHMLRTILNTNKQYISDYRVVIHGEGNFRYDITTIAPYKGNRKEKPMFYPQMKEFAIKEWGEKLILAQGEEADDVCSQLAFKEYQRVGEKKKDWKVCISHIDKDIAQSVMMSHNYDTHEYTWIGRTQAAYNFYTQLLVGDSCDNVMGLVNVPPDIRKQYGLRGRGIGPKAAERLLEGCETPKEMMERVLSLYEVTYGDNWYEVMEENCRLLYLRKLPGEMYNLGDRLKRMGISYDKKS